VKARLRQWAQVVGCAVRQSSSWMIDDDDDDDDEEEWGIIEWLIGKNQTMVIELTTQVQPYVYKWQNSLPNRTGLGPLVNQTQIVLVPIVVGVIIG
jgi:hypothetical protein